MADNKGSQVFTPGKGDAVSVRHIPQTKEDRQKDMKQFKEQKAQQEKIKDERFAEIQGRRKNRGPGGSGAGINIVVDTDKK